MMKYYWIILLTAVMSISACLPGDETQKLPTLLKKLEERTQFSIFLEACNIISLYPQLDGGLNMTIFAPTNSAFEKFFATNGYNSISDVPQGILDQLISYHVQLGIATVADIVPSYYVTPTSAGFDSTALTILIDEVNGEKLLNNKASVSMPDIQGRNGYIHGIDEVLDFPKVLDLFTESRNSIFLEALERTGLKELLEDNDAYTVLVPTDQVFEEYYAANDAISSLDDWQPERLKEIVRYHILEGNIRTSDIDGIPRETLHNGETLNIVIFDNGLLINERIGSLAGDVQGINGVAHFIRGILLPD